MKSERKFEVILLALFLIFSLWLMNKSFGYDVFKHQFRIARHQVGDFGLHLSLIRSFSWGNNFLPESPFFPGKPLPYHYYFDFIVGLLERLGLRIDVAFNGLSVLAFTSLLYLIYKLSQLIFGKSRLLGIVSVLLFIFPSNLAFLDFFKRKTFPFSLLKDLWMIPDYLHKGPFDGSLISIYFTLNVFLNQRHLIAALVIGLGSCYFLIQRIKDKRKLFLGHLVLLGLILGFSFRVHSLIYISNLLVIFLLLILFKKYKWIISIFIPALAIGSWQFWEISRQSAMPMTKNLFHFGFLAPSPLTFSNFLNYWWSNLGLALLLIPLGFLQASKIQKKIFLSFGTLFLIANIFQLSYRPEHNHSLLNYFLIIANFYIAYFLIKLWRDSLPKKIISMGLFLLLTASGVINLMVIKNDFQYPVLDAPANKLMQWIKISTSPRSVFLARQELFDPITLSGRRNFFGATYYLSVMGYNLTSRQDLVKQFFEVSDKNQFVQMKEMGVDYIVLPLKKVPDFNYNVNHKLIEQNLSRVYTDSEVSVYQL